MQWTMSNAAEDVFRKNQVQITWTEGDHRLEATVPEELWNNPELGAPYIRRLGATFAAALEAV